MMFRMGNDAVFEPRSSRAWCFAGLLLLLLLSTVPAQAAVIEGRVTDAVDGTPLAGVTVEATRAGSAQTDADGQYRIENLPAGSYGLFVRHPPAGYVGQIYEGPWCLISGGYPACPFEASFPIEVGVDQVRSGVDLALDREVSISGGVSDQVSGAPVQAEIVAHVCLGTSGSCPAVESGTSDAGGRYSLQLPPAARIYLLAQSDDYVWQVFEGTNCGSPLFCGPGLGREIDASAGQALEDIDFRLQAGGVLQGRVTREDTGEPIEVIAWLHNEAGQSRDALTTDEEGVFEFRSLVPGTYYLRTFSDQWADELLGGLSCPQVDGICDVTRGTPIVVEAGSVISGLDFSLQQGATIAGRLTDAESGAPVRAGRVEALGSNGQRILWAYPDNQGRYRLSGLAAGDYVMAVREAPGFKPQNYNGVTCDSFDSPECDPALSDTVRVEAGQTVEDIDFPLERRGDCVPSDTRLCLNEGRFAVDLNFWDNHGNVQAAHAETVDSVDDTGYFWFFSRDNVEVTVKALDGCGTQIDKFWVFAAGLTNLKTELRVTDTFTDQTRTYHRVAGPAFEPVLDTAAFDTCHVRSGAPRAVASSKPVSSVTDTSAPTRVTDESLPSESLSSESWVSSPVELASRSGGACVPGPGVLCLRDGRFQVEVSWRKPNGEIGTAVALQLSNESGFFWFFRPDNLELMLKVLDNCGGNTNRFWVFAAGLTNVGVEIRVTDTLTGEVYLQNNPVNQPFQPILDTRAFSTCPGG